MRAGRECEECGEIRFCSWTLYGWVCHQCEERLEGSEDE